LQIVDFGLRIAFQSAIGNLQSKIECAAMPRKPTNKTQEQLLAENEDLQRRLDEAEETLNAIRNGEVDAIIVSGADGEQVYTLKQAEAALRESEEKYRQLVEEINDGVYLTDYEGVFTFANPALARIYGVENPQALLGRKILDFTAPEMLKELGQAFRSKMQAGRAPEFIHSQIVRPDGTRVFIEDKSTSRAIGGKVVGSQGVVRDITERKQAEAALVWERYLLSSLLDNLPDHIYFKDCDSRFTRISKSLGEAFGLRDSSEAVGKTDFDFFTEAHAKPAFEAEQKIMATGQPVLGLEEKENWPDGRLTWTNTTKMPLKDQSGTIIGTFGISRDITERKLTEAQLGESEAKLRALFDGAGYAMGMAKAGAQIMVNKAYLELFGYRDVSEVIGNSLLNDIAPEEHPRLQTYAMHRSRGEPAPSSYETLGMRRDGTIFDMDVRISTYEFGEETFTVGIMRDITERNRSEEALRESETEYRNLFENSVVGISQALPDGHLIRANNAYAQMYGYASVEEMIADVTHIGQLYAHPKDREEVLRILSTGGIMEPREMAVVRRDGTQISVLVGARAIRDSKGNLRFYQAEH
jgi:PAS domain S-box-containing protein